MEVLDLFHLLPGEAGVELLIHGDKGLVAALHRVQPLLGDLDQLAPSVLLVGLLGHIAPALHALEAGGHGGRGDVEGIRQLPLVGALLLSGGQKDQGLGLAHILEPQPGHGRQHRAAMGSMHVVKQHEFLRGRFGGHEGNTSLLSKMFGRK